MRKLGRRYLVAIEECSFYEVRGRTTHYGFCLIMHTPPWGCLGDIGRCECDKERRKEVKALYEDLENDAKEEEKKFYERTKM